MTDDLDDDLFSDDPPPPPLERLPYASHVAELIRKHSALDHWRQRCRESFEEFQERQQRHKSWQDARHQHVLQSVRKRARKRRPSEGWVQVRERVFEKGKTWLDIGWVPPEFADTREPYKFGPLPLSRHHKLSLADSYFILALIHDSERKDAGRISPFGPGDGERLALDSEEGEQWVYWHNMFRHVPALSVNNVVTLDECLARVEADVAEPAPRRASGRKRGRPSARDRVQDRRIHEAWATGRYSTHLELAEELRIPKRQVKLALDAHRKRKSSPNIL